jgi:hypothetical protein
VLLGSNNPFTAEPLYLTQYLERMGTGKAKSLMLGSTVLSSLYSPEAGTVTGGEIYRSVQVSLLGLPCFQATT